MVFVFRFYIIYIIRVWVVSFVDLIRCFRVEGIVKVDIDVVCVMVVFIGGDIGFILGWLVGYGFCEEGFVIGF